MLAKIGRTLTLKGDGASSEKPPETRRFDVENPETGCKGTSIFLFKSQPEPTYTFKYEGPYHTDKCKCLTTRDITPDAFQEHLESLLEKGLVDETGLGPVTLSLLLRIPVGEKLEAPVDKTLRLADGEEFPPRIRPTSGVYQSFPTLDESNM